MRNLPTEEERPGLQKQSGGPQSGSAGAAASPPARRRRFRPLYLVLAIVVVGLLVIWKMNHARTGFPKGPGGGRHAYAMGGGAMPVVVQPASQGNLPLFLNGLGTVTPLAMVTLRTQISGVLIQVAFKEGQMVKQGDLLAVIDPRPYQVALEQAQGQLLQAQSQLAQAKSDLIRYQTLAKQDSIALQQVDTQNSLVSQYEGLVKTDQAAIDSANLNLTYCHITAPVDGRVGLRMVDAGNYVTPGDANGLVVLTEIKPITVIFTLPEDNIPAVAERLRAGATLRVTAFDRAQTKRLATGVLSTIDNQVDPSTGTFRLRAQFANDDEGLFPNQFVNIRMLLDVERDAILIPTSGIERGQQGTYVYVVKPDKTVTARPITLGPTEGEKAVVTAGLALGENIVVDGADKLKEGMEVTIQTPAATAKPGAAAGAAGAPHRHRHPAGSGNGAPPASGAQN